MNFITAYHTDIGIKKKTNQDALCIKVANTNIGKVAFTLICDGMGGLSKGEMASAVVTREFSEWFDYQFPKLLQSNLSLGEQVNQQWREMILGLNLKLRNYGSASGAQLGTTITAILFVKDDYYVLNVGDSRIYEISDRVVQLTHDQSLVAKEIELGNITPEQAKRDPRRNVLLQCIGASSNVEPEFIKGKAKENCTYMLCSDGFIHEILEEEIFQNLNADILVDQKIMKERAKYLVDLNKSRMEQDNISVLLLRTF